MKTTPKTTRVSVPVTAEVLLKFQRFAAVSGLSVGKSMGEWLHDTQQGLDFMTETLEKHKAKPKEAMRELEAYAQTLHGMTEDVLTAMRQDKKTAASVPTSGGASAAVPIPPPCNTGGKVPQNKAKQSKGKA